MGWRDPAIYDDEPLVGYEGLHGRIPIERKSGDSKGKMR